MGCDKEVGMLLIDILKVDKKCSFCGKEITKDNFGGIFSKPTRVCCKNILCLTKATKEE